MATPRYIIVEKKDEVYLKIWKLLNEGLRNRDASFHIPVFVCGEKNKFDSRIVVLRGVSETEKKNMVS